jgi:hypothetical protein
MTLFHPPVPLTATPGRTGLGSEATFADANLQSRDRHNGHPRSRVAQGEVEMRLEMLGHKPSMASFFGQAKTLR